MTTAANSTSSNKYEDIYASLNGTRTSKTTTTAAGMENSFLTLLTTQLQNQDPLNPLDNAQVTTQLAQINTVSGIERLNTTLGKLLSAYDNAQAMQSSSLIGHGVLVAGKNMTLSKEIAGAGYKLDEAADQVVLKIMDADGKVVQSQTLGAHEAGVFSFVWDGKDGDGNALKDGAYQFSVEATKGKDKVAATALQVGMVSAVTRSSSGFVLDLGNLGSVKFDDVQQIL